MSIRESHKTMRFNEEEEKMLEVIRKKTGSTSDSEAIRFAVTGFYLFLTSKSMKELREDLHELANGG